MAKINVTLFHADWCGHCTSFMPEWKQLEAKFKNDPSVSLNSFESSDPKFSRNAKINGAQIQGFPTIRIKIGEQETEYNDERSSAALSRAIEDLKGAVQAGGKRKAKKAGSKVKKAGKTKSKSRSKSKRSQSRTKKTKSKSKGSKVKKTKTKTKSKSKSKGKKAMRGGGFEGMNEQQIRELLQYKINKYEHAYNKLHKDLKDKGIL